MIYLNNHLLLKIKQAQMPFEELVPLVESLEQEVNTLAKQSKLPDTSNTKQIAKLYYDIAKDFYKLENYI